MNRILVESFVLTQLDPSPIVDGIAELLDSQLALIGGGIADTVPH